jgi:hypothetical protein
VVLEAAKGEPPAPEYQNQPDERTWTVGSNER